MKKYNHAFDIAFSIVTEASCKTENDGDYPTEQEIFEALEKRISDLKKTPGVIFEAIGAPFDTYIDSE